MFEPPDVAALEAVLSVAASMVGNLVDLPAAPASPERHGGRVVRVNASLHMGHLDAQQRERRRTKNIRNRSRRGQPLRLACRDLPSPAHCGHRKHGRH